MIAESHISLHGRGRLAFCDVFSCAPFNPDVMEAVLMDVLGGRFAKRQIDRPAVGVAGVEP
jgi:S-adenosylmethionine/arginine decarboxylase-like enzyme